jgi:hypothetical protein
LIKKRGNLITDAKEVSKLQVLPKLKAIVLLDTPLTENQDYRLEVLIAIRRLERLDKDAYIDEERTEAEEIYEQRRKAEEEEALQNADGDNNNGDESLSGDKTNDETIKADEESTNNEE